MATIYMVTRLTTLNDDKYNSFLLWLSKNRHTTEKKKKSMSVFWPINLERL